MHKINKYLFFQLIKIKLFTPSFEHASPPDPPPITMRSYSCESESKKELNLYHTLHFIDTDLLTSKLILICYVNGLCAYFCYWTETSL